MSKRILVVEDQPDNRQIIRDMLAPTGYEITEVENGEEALAAIAKQRPDLILMDIQLPVMDGYEATRQIKADPALRSIPIIAVTSYALSGEETKARSAGCDEYVPKPFSPRQLMAKIRNFLQQSRSQLLQCMSPLLAQSGHFAAKFQCPILEAKRTFAARGYGATQAKYLHHSRANAWSVIHTPTFPETLKSSSDVGGRGRCVTSSYA
jgi:two-component system, cell cycle response regulator DivK